VAQHPLIGHLVWAVLSGALLCLGGHALAGPAACRPGATRSA
jgi:hypothetical protein